jgi:exodeoxyribonuclease VII small subunit
MIPRMGEAADPSYDQVIVRLRAVVERLETGQLGLEEALAAYEEGVALARRGHALLDTAERKVELLAGPGGATTPLDPEDKEPAPRRRPEPG